MKIATYNVNGINGRLDILSRWLNEDVPDVVCLQELKTDDAGDDRCGCQRLPAYPILEIMDEC
ncbi:endonuclease/exonuclease/phosphatase family protein, partial [Rhizobium johnstonii]|uniref:endonuclease/exonuclease/phosphatase family protein n=1 Tax=Rhizobium johnstonii TaxID=3019933 RepID=UPI003F9D71A4